MSKPDPSHRKFRKHVLAGAVVVAALLSGSNAFAFPSREVAATPVPKPQGIPYSEAIADADSGKIANISIDDRNGLALVTLKNTAVPPQVVAIPSTDDGQTQFRNRLDKDKVPYDFNLASSDAMKPQSGFSFPFANILMEVALIGGLMYFFSKRQGGGMAGRMSFGKSKAKLITEVTGRKTFADVEGINEAKEQLADVVDFLKNPEKYQRLGAKIPKGVLLTGPPGTGKTLLARATAGEAGVPFYTISGSDFVEMFVGVGASRVRDMFAEGKKNSPCIIFIDEIDAVGRHRGSGMAGNDEREQTLNQLLVEMDGFAADDNANVVIIAATNRPDVLDSALLRPGRFDRQVVVPTPDVTGREHIIGVHVRNKPLAPDVDRKKIAKATPGFSGADLANLVNEAALAAAKQGRKMITMAHLEEARDTVMMGPQRKSMAMSAEERTMTAYHEAGHALLAILDPRCDPVHKATILPRGRALGMVMSLPEGDRYSMSKGRLKSQLVMAMGGRAAEELIFGEENVSNGASGDIKMATDQARRMVAEWGMSDKIGMVARGGGDQGGFLGRGPGFGGGAVDSKDVMDEIKAIIDTAYETARTTLKANEPLLHQFARALLEHETLDGGELRGLAQGQPLRGKPPESYLPPQPAPAQGGSPARRLGDSAVHP